MAKNGRSGPSIFPAILASIVVFAVLAYLFVIDVETSRTEHTVNPPIEIVEAKPAVTVIEEEVAPSQEQVLEQEASVFIEGLAEQTKQSITLKENEDQFVRHDNTIVLPNLEHRMTSIQELLADTNLTPDTPISLQYTSKEHVTTTLAELSDQYHDHTVLITVIDQTGTQHTKPLFEFLNAPDVNVTAPITIVVEQKHTIESTVAELSSLTTIDSEQSLVATINHGTQELSIKDIVQNGNLPDNALFYLHRVTEADKQGLWGIVQAGLIDKFREGVSIEGLSSNKDTVQAIIPADADEKLPSGLSSFLGKILNDKVTTSYVYNYNTHVMTNDPNRIYPGQQLILIHFNTNELSDIYQFFSDKRNQGVETFAIGD